MNKFYFGQDSEIAPLNIKELFNLKEGIDIRYLKSINSYVYNFVGFVIKKNITLIVFPKHFYNEYNYELINNSDNKQFSKLLFKTLTKYISTSESNNNKYYGPDKNFESDFPFAAFYIIYDYYKRYGLYYEDKKILKNNNTGNYDWKKTIQKSNIIISNHNLIYTPIYSNQKIHKTNFISDCMIYAINNTLDVFPFLDNVIPIKNKISDNRIFNNFDYIIRNLESYKRNIFKDTQKKLINALIDFFSFDKKIQRGGKRVIKVNYFASIWQSMINEYLNKHFISFDEAKNTIIFDNSQTKSSIVFSPKTIQIDRSHHQFEIELDHYAYTDNAQYIFDSKYYYDIDDLNYKQFTYNILLGNSESYKRPKLFSCLILPGNKKNDLNLNLIDDIKIEQRLITEQYISIQDVMNDYIKTDY